MAQVIHGDEIGGKENSNPTPDTLCLYSSAEGVGQNSLLCHWSIFLESHWFKAAFFSFLNNKTIRGVSIYTSHDCLMCTHSTMADYTDSINTQVKPTQTPRLQPKNRLAYTKVDLKWPQLSLYLCKYQ